MISKIYHPNPSKMLSRSGPRDEYRHLSLDCLSHRNPPQVCYTPCMKHIARSALIIAVFFGLEKMLGFVRNVLIAQAFNLSTELDAFNAANNIPDLIFALISGGALAMAFIPVLSEYS